MKIIQWFAFESKGKKDWFEIEDWKKNDILGYGSASWAA